jgi:hypothetical protein
MLRLQADEGWWLVTHPDHAHLAGEFASKWGNAQFAPPEPREHVLHGIYAHDDGWTERDAKPQITKQGRPAAFSTELVGTYSAFEEIDLAAYLAKEDPYAAILISMHTQNLLTDRADRSSIRPEHLPWLDVFLVEQSKLQRALRDQLISEGRFAEKHVSLDNLHMNFQLLQGCDNLSLLSCVDFGGGATLLHPFATVDGEMSGLQSACSVFRRIRWMSRRSTSRCARGLFHSLHSSLQRSCRFCSIKHLYRSWTY